MTVTRIHAFILALITATTVWGMDTPKPDPKDPEKKDAIYKRIQDYGYSRIVSGAHFRSDVYAGNVAGAAIAASLLSNESFRNEFKDVKGELRKAVGLAD